jgi:hypothetical protein
MFACECGKPQGLEIIGQQHLGRDDRWRRRLGAKLACGLPFGEYFQGLSNPWAIPVSHCQMVGAFCFPMGAGIEAAAQGAKR